MQTYSVRFALFGFALAACGPPPLSMICSSAQHCPAGATYVLCTSDAGTSAYYSALSEGVYTTFPCVSASDCSAALSQVTDWCNAH